MTNKESVLLLAVGILFFLLLGTVVLNPGIQPIYVQNQPIVQKPETPKATPSAPPYAPNYPIGMEVTSYVGKSDLDPSFVPKELSTKVISVVHKVTFDEKDKKFIYHYRISFVGKEKCFFAWELLDRVLNNGEVIATNAETAPGLPRLIELEPEKVVEYSLSSDLPPALYDANAWIYKKKGNHWEIVKVNAQPGPLPRRPE